MLHGCTYVVVLLDCWTSIHLGQRTCPPSESLLQCIFQRLAVWTSLLVAYPEFLFATTIELILDKYGWGTDPSPYHWLGGVEWNWTILCYVTSLIFWVQLLKVFWRPSNLMIQRTWRRAKAAARLALWEIAPWENCLLRTEIHYETIWNYCDNYELTRISNVTLVWFINVPPFVGADSICPRRPNWGASAAWFISIIWMKSFLQPNPHSHMHWLQLQLQSILTCFYYISFIAIHRYASIAIVCMHFFQLVWIQPILFSNATSRRLGCANFFALMLRRLGWEWWKDWPTSCAFTSSFCRFLAVTNTYKCFNIDHIQVFQYLKNWFKCMVRSHEIL